MSPEEYELMREQIESSKGAHWFEWMCIIASICCVVLGGAVIYDIFFS